MAMFSRTSLPIPREDLTLTGGREPEPLSGIAVSGNTFSFLGVAPLIGRAILPSDAGQRVARADTLRFGTGALEPTAPSLEELWS